MNSACVVSFIDPFSIPQASFSVEALTWVMDGGKKMTARRRFISSTQKDMDVQAKHDWSRLEGLTQHLVDFYGIHKKFVGRWRPTRDDIVW